ncbi:hypothetical protein [Streptomyces aurantiogriseus]|uniref:Membrane protein n=1 Tax=Streptomyces aurantiogriseus TaxID=66870 RepID=A0A918KY28_9ACTN|nr:hypothetical protein [Streptomyces aurantiogriseus]GGR45221.1 membrane protein [Streptomyces aurantiogriseus]
MGIESDQVVYEYLSRVGDVAQQRQLSSATRMRLVSELRNEIDRRRAKAPLDSPAAVRRIIARLGSPDEVVAAAAGDGPGVPEAREPSVPAQRDRRGEEERPKGIRRIVPRPRPRSDVPPTAPSDVPSPPHRAGAHELGDTTETPDWWRREPDPLLLGDEVPGFVGGVEIPDMLKPPPSKEKEVVEAERAESAADEGVADEAPARRRRRLPSLRPGRWSNPLLLIAAGCLVVGAVIGKWPVLLVGWLIAYASRRLTERETQWAVMVLPGLSVAAGVVWLWGRTEGRWGAPIAEGQMNDAVGETLPWVVRGAAVASALFLVWRSQRER